MVGRVSTVITKSCFTAGETFTGDTDVTVPGAAVTVKVVACEYDLPFKVTTSVGAEPGASPDAEPTTIVFLPTLTRLHSEPPRVILKLAPNFCPSCNDNGKKSP